MAANSSNSILRNVVLVFAALAGLALHPARAAIAPLVDGATPAAAVGDSRKPTLEAIEEKRARLQEDIEAARAALKSASPAVAGVTEQLSEHVRLLERISLTVFQQGNLLKQIESLESNRTQYVIQLEQLRANGPSEKPPYSYFLYDNLRTELSAEREKRASIEESIEAARTALEQARRQLDERDAARIRFREEIQKNAETGSLPAMTARLKTLLYESNAAAETVALRELELAAQRKTKEVYEARLAYLQERVGMIGREARFRPEDLREQLDTIAKYETELEEARGRAEDRYRVAVAQWESAYRRLASETEPDPLLVEDELAKRSEKDRHQAEISIATDRLARTTERRTIWQRRFDTVNLNASISELNQWRSESVEKLESLDSDEKLIQTAAENLRRELANLDGKLEQYANDPKVRQRVEEQKAAIVDIIALFEQNIASIGVNRGHYRKLVMEIDEQIQGWSWDELWEYARIYLDSYLDTVVWKIDDNNLLTLGKIIQALVYFIASMIAARFISRTLLRLALSRMGVHEGASHAIQSLLFYTLVLIFFVVTLNAIYIDITAFAFLGGALAIGVGFGSQNIVNNFISGLILLIERPVRVGDMVEVEGTMGTVSRIGLRCTQILTFTNIDVMVPNSYFLENRVVNWTLGDNIVRTSIRVGVAYGTDAKLAMKLIRKATEEHGLVLKKPEPFVTLTDFGDNALVLEIRFWILMNERTNKLIVESEVRLNIYSSFREAGIEIAFPQRDVHLDASGPFEVRLLREGEGRAAAPEGSS